MPFDRAKNFIFVHIPKTGGTSIEHLFDLWKEPQSSEWQTAKVFSSTTRPQHYTWTELIRCLPVDFVESAYKFGFVRNPWDRFLSEYKWRQQRYLRRLKRSGASFYDKCHYNESHILSLDAFVKTLELPRERRVEAGIGFDGHLETQLSFVIDDTGRVAMDFIGRFERFEFDVRAVAHHIGYEIGVLPHLFRGDRDTDYRGYYSAYSKGAVESFYKEDIVTFGYQF